MDQITTARPAIIRGATDMTDTAGMHAPQTAAPFIIRAENGICTLHLVVGGMHCAGCIAKIERAVRALPDITDARVNLSTGRLRACWSGADAEMPARIAQTVRNLGFTTSPFDPQLMAQTETDAERRLMRAMAVAGFAAANIMLLSVAVWSGADMDVATRALMHWVSALIALPAVVYAGQPFYRSALAALRARQMNMDVPISLAVLLATAMSLFQTIMATRHGTAGHVYFDASVSLLFFLLIGRFLDLRTRGRARETVRNLMALRALTATRIGADGSHHPIATADVMPGMRIAVAAGGRVPVDAIVRRGRSELDASILTGESLPQPVEPGDKVCGGALNLGQPIEVQATAVDEDSLIGEIVRLMEAAEQGRAAYVRLADAVARIYAPGVHLLAFCTFLGWLLLGAGGWEPALMNAVAVLIITCPCALGLAAPAAQIAASGRLFRAGILVKAADGLERIAQTDHVVFDKTGTLTEGRPELINRNEICPEAFTAALALARHSQHPLSRALTRAAGKDTPLTPQPDGLEEVAGSGLRGTIGGRECRLGRAQWCGVDQPDTSAGHGPELWLTRADEPPIKFLFADRLRPEMADTIARLRELGLSVELLSGDRASVAAAIASELGIDEWRGDCRPGDKVARLHALRAAGHKVLMVGDGLNDAPALAEAHASISPAVAAEISQNAADFVLQGETLQAVPETIRIARATRRRVIENFGIAFAYNAVAIPFAVAGFVTPLFAALAMSGSSLVVTLNALRLRLGEKGYGR